MRAAIRKSLRSYLRKITANASPSPRADSVTNSFSDSWLPGTCIASGVAAMLDLKFFIDKPTCFPRRAVRSGASISEKSRSALGESFHFSLFRHELFNDWLSRARGAARPPPRIHYSNETITLFHRG